MGCEFLLNASPTSYCPPVPSSSAQSITTSQELNYWTAEAHEVWDCVMPALSWFFLFLFYFNSMDAVKPVPAVCSLTRQRWVQNILHTRLCAWLGNVLCFFLRPPATVRSTWARMWFPFRYTMQASITPKACQGGKQPETTASLFFFFFFCCCHTLSISPFTRMP